MVTKFPVPVRFGERAIRYRLSDLERYEAALAGEPPPENLAERYLTTREVADRLGVSVPSVWRWACTARTVQRGRNGNE